MSFQERKAIRLRVKAEKAIGVMGLLLVTVIVLIIASVV